VGNLKVPKVKGRRNYIQLSDGSDDLMINENLYATSNGSISGHISGSGTATEMAYFTGPETIASTPAAIVETTGTGQILLDVGSEASPTLAFQGGDTDTGIYHPANNQIGVSAGGNIEMGISTAGVSVQEGSESIPSYNFGLTTVPDTDTGMFRIDHDTIGFSTGGVQKVGIFPADSGDFIEGINVGKPGSPATAGIRRLSEVAANSWEDGHMGNSAALIFTATDFRQESSTRSQQVTSSQPDPAAASSRWYGLISNDGDVVAQKVVPKGFVIDDTCEITIYTPVPPLTPNQTGNCFVSGQSVAIGGTDALTNLLSLPGGLGGPVLTTNTATPLSGGGSLIGDGLNIITIYWNGVALTSANSIAGAKITMKRV
jgi:hypothetical protein